MIPDLEPYLNADEPWVRWAAMRWLQERPLDDPELHTAHRATLEHPLMRSQLEQVLADPWPPMKNHKQASHPLHRLGLLMELGLSGADPEGRAVAERLLAGQADEGPFRLLALIPKAFGGSGQPEWIWMACDAPLLLDALAGLGLAQEARVRRAAEHCAGLVEEKGWLCSTGPGFRGPGKKGDPCPYANLLALRALSRFPELLDSPATRAGTEMLLRHWEHQQERKLYLFGIGTDYRKPKYPLIWYDILHALTVLVRFPWVHGDPQFREQVTLLAELAGSDGAWKPTTVWVAYKGFDFSQKRGPSPTLALAIERVLRSAEA
jgi:hypothetical protein